MTRRYPPKRICQGCGGQYYAWQESGICLRCRRSSQPDASALAGEVRRRRLERWEAAGIVPNERTSNDERIDDGIPY